MRRMRYRPSKASCIFGGVVGIVFTCIGVFVVIPSFGPFGIFWTLIAVGITATNGINAFGKKGVASHEIIIEESGGGQKDGGSGGSDVERRLEEARGLYERGLISREEYEAKRAEILKDL